MSEEGKKIKGKLSEFYLFLGIFIIFLLKKYILAGDIYVMSEEKIEKKLNGQSFFLVGPDSSTSEESSTVEYSACALKSEKSDNGFAWISAQPLLDMHTASYMSVITYFNMEFPHTKGHTSNP